MGEPEKEPEPDVVAATFDQMGEALNAIGPGPAALVIDLGNRGHFWASDIVRASEALNFAISKLSDEQTLILTIGGYDDDPRELYNVAEVVQFLRRVFKQAGITHWSHPAVKTLNEESLALLLQCGVFGSDHPWRIQHTQGRDSASMLRRFKR